jgi:hypothetical protein
VLFNDSQVGVPEPASALVATGALLSLIAFARRR